VKIKGREKEGERGENHSVEERRSWDTRGSGAEWVANFGAP